MEDITTAMNDWEQANQDDIERLVILIDRILIVTKNGVGA